MVASNGILQINAQLRYYMHLEDPDRLTDDEWALQAKSLEWIRREEAKSNR